MSKPNLKQENPSLKTDPKIYWEMVFFGILMFGIFIGMLGRTIMKTPPIVSLIEISKKQTMTADSLNRIEKKVDSVDEKVSDIEKQLIILKKGQQQ